MTVFQQTVEAVRTAYPKFSPACLSLSCRTRQTGVTMTAKAMKLADSVGRTTTPYRASSENRVKSVHFRCRLAPALASVVKDEMTMKGVSQQDLLEGLLLRWIEENRPTVCKTEGRCEEKEDAEPLSLHNNTNKEEKQ